jgi:hypothetical protein
VPYRHWTFTIPKAIRGLFERERRLLGLLSRTAYDSIRKSFQTLFGRKDVRPGCVISIQSFGSFGANFHPHCGAQMKIVSFITEPRVVDRILRHLASEACKARDPFDPRAPPAAASPSPT